MSNPNNPNNPDRYPGGDLLDAALSALDQPLPEPRQPKRKDTPAASTASTADTADTQGMEPTPQGGAPSPTLAGLDKTRRPKASTVCEACPNSVWFASPAEVKCYCRVMFLVTWSSREPQQITACDGVFLGQDSQSSQESQDN